MFEDPVVFLGGHDGTRVQYHAPMRFCLAGGMPGFSSPEIFQGGCPPKQEPELTFSQRPTHFPYVKMHAK